MNQRNRNHSSTASWTFTGIAGAVSTAAVTALLGIVLSAPAHSAPATYIPADPGIVTSATSDNSRTETGNCFMGRHSWPKPEGSIPQCPVG